MSLYKSKRIEKWRSNVIIFFLMAYPIMFSSQFESGLRWKTPIIPIFFPLHFHSNQTLKNYIFLFMLLSSYFILFLSTPTTHCIRPVKKWDDSYVRKVTEWVGSSWSIESHESAFFFPPLLSKTIFILFWFW